MLQACPLCRLVTYRRPWKDFGESAFEGDDVFAHIALSLLGSLLQDGAPFVDSSVLPSAYARTDPCINLLGVTVHGVIDLLFFSFNHMALSRIESF